MADSDSKQTTFKRVMLKISGEALMGDQGYGLHPPTVERIAREVKSVHDMGVEICMAFRVRPKGWSGPQPTIWACSPQ